MPVAAADRLAVAVLPEQLGKLRQNGDVGAGEVVLPFAHRLCAHADALRDLADADVFRRTVRQELECCQDESVGKVRRWRHPNPFVG